MATGIINQAEEAVTTAIADCPAFRTWAGVGTTEAGLAKMYRGELPQSADDVAYTKDELAALLPYAIYTTEHVDISTPATGTLSGSFTVRFAFEQTIPPDQVRNTGAALGDMQALLGQLPEQLNEQGSLHNVNVQFGGASEFTRTTEDEGETIGHIITLPVTIQWGTS